MKCRIFGPLAALALTICSKDCPFFSVNQESPFLPVAFPAVSQPGSPALAGLMVILSVFGLNPCHWAIAWQMCFGAKQFCRADGVFGTEPGLTSEKVCGPTCFGFVVLTIFSMSPWVTVFGPTNFRLCPSALM